MTCGGAIIDRSRKYKQVSRQIETLAKEFQAMGREKEGRELANEGVEEERIPTRQEGRSILRKGNGNPRKRGTTQNQKKRRGRTVGN